MIAQRTGVLLAFLSAACAIISVSILMGLGPLTEPRPPSAAVHKPRQLQQELCNAAVYAPQPVTPVAFNLPGGWNEACHGRPYGTMPAVAAPPSAAHWPGQQNWCWNWVKHKGCKEVMAAYNWNDAQQRAAALNLAPPVATAPLNPLRNPEKCSASSLGATVYADAAETEAAKAWLRSTAAVYVLNLPEDLERQQSMSSRLGELGIEFSFIPGVDMSKPGAFAAAKQSGLIPSTFDFAQAQQTAHSGIAGSVGCAAAHLGAQRKVLAKNQQQPLAIIFEDDTRLEDDFAVKLRRLLTNEAPCDWTVISLKSACPYGECVSEHLTRVFPDGNEPAARCRHGVNYGFYGMVYRLDALQDLNAKLSQRVWDASAPHCLDVDVALASISDQIPYYAVPYFQTPGFLSMGGHGSTRNQRDQSQVIPPDGPAPPPPSPSSSSQLGSDEGMGSGEGTGSDEGMSSGGDEDTALDASPQQTPASPAAPAAMMPQPPETPLHRMMGKLAHLLRPR